MNGPVLILPGLYNSGPEHWQSHWERAHPEFRRVLVAPSDTEAPRYPEGPEGFKPMPRNRLPFPSIVVASTDDPYVTLERARVRPRLGASLSTSAPPGT